MMGPCDICGHPSHAGWEDGLLECRDRLREQRDDAKDALEERMADVHARIRADYDKTVADSWRAASDKLRAENERLRRFVASLAESPANALDVEMIVAAAATVLGSESEGDPHG